MKHTPLIIYGKHAALAALANPMRKIKRVLVTKSAKAECEAALKKIQNISLVDGQKISSMLQRDAVHQGIAVECSPLEQLSLQQWLANGDGKPALLLDQVSDPHNVGAMLRSALAFGIGAVIITDRNAPGESGVMAKSASGALEEVPLISVGNLVQAIELLKKEGYWTYGLDGTAKKSIGDIKFDAKSAIIMGAEGKGLRRLTADHCDFLMKIPMTPNMESLNVSNAAAITLYEVFSSKRNIG